MGDVRRTEYRVWIIERIVVLQRWAFQVASGKEPARQCRRHKRYRYWFDSWVWKIP